MIRLQPAIIKRKRAYTLHSPHTSEWAIPLTTENYIVFNLFPNQWEHDEAYAFKFPSMKASCIWFSQRDKKRYMLYMYEKIERRNVSDLSAKIKAEDER